MFLMTDRFNIDIDTLRSALLSDIISNSTESTKTYNSNSSITYIYTYMLVNIKI